MVNGHVPPKVFVLETDRAACQASVVEVLEDALRAARAGEVASVALAIVAHSGAICTSRSDTEDVGRLLGAMALAQAHLLEALEG